MASLLEGGGVDQDTVNAVLDYLGKGAIIEGGPSASYQKFANGLMIQWGKKVATSNEGKNVSFTFLAPFIEPPVIASMNQSNGRWPFSFFQEGALTATSFSYGSAGRESYDASTGLCWIAIGAWK